MLAPLRGFESSRFGEAEDGPRREVECVHGEVVARPAFGEGGIQGAQLPKGRVLEPNRELLLFDEEVPREGARVTRTYQYARWIDGSTHLWIGRRKGPGRGEGSSGLEFDVAEKKE